MTQLKLVPPGICPNCRQPMPAKGRTCGTCGKPILKRHKFYFDGATARHRSCEQPEAR